jgi:hypothetical protein
VREHGSPHAIFERSVKNGNLLMAEAITHELPPLRLGDALELTALIALKDHRRAGRAGARWLRLYLNNAEMATLRDASTVIGCLAALGGPEHEHALTTLRAMSIRATTAARGRAVA